MDTADWAVVCREKGRGVCKEARAVEDRQSGTGAMPQPADASGQEAIARTSVTLLSSKSYHLPVSGSMTVAV